MINHVTVKVKDFDKEEAFYEAALAPLGYGKGPAFPGVQAFVAEDGSSVWVSTAAEGDAVAPAHVAFEAADDDAVKAFHEAGLANGGTDNGQPGPRPDYGPTYYAAFVLIRRATTSKPCTTDRSSTDRAGIPSDGTRLPSDGIVIIPPPTPTHHRTAATVQHAPAAKTITGKCSSQA